jgi:hypothetical protein
MNPIVSTAMKIYRRPLWALVFVAACSGDSSRDSAEIADGQNIDAMVQGVVITTAPVIGRPMAAQASPGLLWLLDGAGDPSVHLISLPSGALQSSRGRRGRGPGEFVSPWALSTRPTEQDFAVWIFDLAMQQMSRVALEASDAQRSVTLKSADRVLSARWLNDSVILGVTSVAARRFVLFDSSGSVIHTRSGPLLGESHPGMNEATRQRATAAGFRLCGAPKPHTHAIVYFAAGRVEMYDTAGSFVRGNTPYPTDVALVPDQGGDTKIDYSRRYYVDCTATAEQLYALFSGRLEADYETGEERSSGEYVHVFNPKGELVHQLKLSEPVATITVSPDGRRLYAGSAVTAAVYEFDIFATYAPERP